MNTILRIEHPEDGVGIFMSRNKDVNMSTLGIFPDVISSFEYNSAYIGDINYRHTKMPRASREYSLFQIGKHYCAYPSVDIMKKWINCTEIKQLIEIGFVVLLLDVTECYISEY